MCRDLAIAFDHVQVIAGNHRNHRIFTLCNQFVIDLDCLEYCVDIRVLGISKRERIRCVQACHPTYDRAFNVRLPPDIIVPVYTQDESPTYTHSYT
jgi:hypothetical protein